ncbi:MAG: nodulation protein NfeD [Thermoanaerobaculia bacterium]
MSILVHRRLRIVVSLLLLAVGAAFGVADEPKEKTEAEPAPTVVHIRLDSIIHPVAATFVRESLAQAEEMNADAFVIELSTPGGLLTSTREIFTDMLGSEVPVVVYVSPSGAQAASAGFFILMAADIAAMAPGTNTGAAHPVSGGGEDITGVMGEKVEQDAAATIRSLATRNGRNAELAEAAVVESRSFTADEALKEGLIELIADDLPALLEAIHDRELSGEGEESSKMRTAAAEIRTLEMSTVQKILSTIAHPNIAYILMTLGGLGLYFELSNPGAILPGVIGGICLILAFFALSVLPVNSAGIALIILAVIFFIAEIKVTSYGMLTVAGLISMVLGSMMLFKSVDPAVRVSMSLIISAALFTAAVVTFLVTMVIRTHGRQVQTGIEGLVNRSGVARTDLTPQGKVFVHGEIWNAVAEESVAAGTPVQVVAVEGMRLRVRAEA